MARTLTNNISMAYAKEASLGVLPGSPLWKSLEPNSIAAFGSSVTTVARSPISKNRQRRKGTVTDLDSKVEFDADLTFSHLYDFIESFLMASFTSVPVFTPTAATASGYTVASGGTLAQNTLIFVRGFVNPVNNGLKVVGSGSTATNIAVTGLTVETAPANAEVAVTGVRSAAGDLDVDASGNITSSVLNFTTLGLTVGQSIWVGGEASINRFSNAANKGFARIKAIAAGLLTLDKKSQAFVTEANTAQQVDLYFGRFCRNVPVDHGSFLSQSFQFEMAYPNLGAAGATAYEYAKGNLANTLSFDLPLSNKSTISLAFVGTDTASPTETRAANAASALLPIQIEAFNTSADIGRLRVTDVDETGLTTDFKSVSMKLNNNIGPEKVLGVMGAKYMNTGNFEVDLEAKVLFSDPNVLTRIRNNTRVTMDFSLRNTDGAFLVDIPSLTLGDGAKEFPLNQSIQISVKSEAFGDAVLGYSLGLSIFPFCPNF